MSEIKTRDFLSSILDDLAEVTGLGRSTRRINQIFFRRYEFGSIVVEFGYVDSKNSIFRINPTLPIPRGLYLNMGSYIMKPIRPQSTALARVSISLADPDFHTKAIDFINNALSVSMV